MKKLAGLLNDNMLALNDMPNVRLEWILVNDSPDTRPDTAHIHLDIPIRVLTHNENLGIHKARITGLLASQADWVLFLDQDDIISENMIRNMLRDGNIDRADILVCNAICETKDKSVYRLYNKETDLRQVGKLSVYLKITDVICSPGQCLIRRTAIPMEWKKMFLGINGSDDLMLWIMMLSRKSVVHVLPDVYYRHTYTGHNVSGSEEQVGRSSGEVADLLFHSGFLTSYQYHVLKRSILWSMRSRKQNVIHFYQSPDIIAYRFYWKIRKFLSAKLPDVRDVAAETNENSVK